MIKLIEHKSTPKPRMNTSFSKPSHLHLSHPEHPQPSTTVHPKAHIQISERQRSSCWSCRPISAQLSDIAPQALDYLKSPISVIFSHNEITCEFTHTYIAGRSRSPSPLSNSSPLPFPLYFQTLTLKFELFMATEEATVVVVTETVENPPPEPATTETAADKPAAKTGKAKEPKAKKAPAPRKPRSAPAHPPYEEVNAFSRIRKLEFSISRFVFCKFRDLGFPILFFRFNFVVCRWLRTRL